MDNEELKRQAAYFASREINWQSRTIYRDGDFVDGFVAVIGRKPVMWEKTFCATRDEALEEARLFQENARRVLAKLP